MIYAVEPYVVGVLVLPKPKTDLVLDLDGNTQDKAQGHFLLQDYGNYDELSDAIGKELIINPGYTNPDQPQIFGTGHKDPHDNDLVLIPRHAIMGYHD